MKKHQTQSQTQSQTQNQPNKPLNKIKSRWTKIYQLKARNHPPDTVQYFTQKYFDAIAAQVSRKRSDLSPLQCEEIASDVLFELFKENFKNLRKLSRDQGNFRGVLSKIITSKLSRLARRKEIPHEDLPEVPVTPYETLDTKEDLHHALHRLSVDHPELHQTVMAVYFDEKTVPQAAAQLKISKDAVYMRLSRARTYLGEALTGYE